MTFSTNVASNKISPANVGGVLNIFSSQISNYLSPFKFAGLISYYRQGIYDQGLIINVITSSDCKKFINSNNSTLPGLVSSYASDKNYVIVNNGSSNWTLNLPLGPGNSNSSSWTKGMEIIIKKTGSGTLTIQTQNDVAGVKVRGINSLSNKSLILSSSNSQVVKLLYTSEANEAGDFDSTAEIWYSIQNSILNSTSSNGSILFAGNTSSYLTVANDADLRFGTGDFTIEWWQYETDSNSFPRIFSMGTYPSTSIGVSIEGGSFYVWIGGAANLITTLSNYKNAFNHFAITRSGTTIKVFRNGTQIGSNITSSYDFNDTTNDLRIGNEQTLSSGSSFGGNIKGFHWVKGTALYTTTFTPNYNSITPHANSKLLLNVANSVGLVTDSSGSGKTVTNTGCTFSSITHPFY